MKIWLIKFSAAFILLLFMIIQIFANENYDKKKAEKLYKQHCSNCHRNNGRGVKRVYPPLKKSDYVEKAGKIELLRGMLFGRSGKIVVNGYKYDGVMTTEIDESLSDSDIALILTYVYVNFNDMDISVSADDVVKARKEGKLPEHK